MRNMMICVSVMLAVFLGWPLAFGGKEVASIDAGSAVAHSVTVAPPLKPVPVEASVPAVPQAESCYKRYQREIKTCTGVDNAACRQQKADHWDMCEATGFWPQ